MLCSNLIGRFVKTLTIDRILYYVLLESHMEVQKMGPILLLALACLLNSCVAAEDPDANLIVTRASREVDLSSSVVKQSVTFTFENSGTSLVSSFHYVVESNFAQHLAYISAEVNNIYIRKKPFSSCCTSHYGLINTDCSV